MTDQQRPDEDVEGHRRHFFEDPEETGTTEELEDDVEGHGRARLDDDASDDDVEGHSNVARRPL
jgi:hypothetical protein